MMTVFVFFLWKTYNYPPSNPAEESYRLIAADPVTAPAFVVKTGSHWSHPTRGPATIIEEFKYQFKVDGKLIEGPLDGPHKEGTMITVTYNKANPNLHCLGTPTEHIERRSWLGFVLTTLLALMVGGTSLLVVLGP